MTVHLFLCTFRRTKKNNKLPSLFEFPPHIRLYVYLLIV
jgi:hypothetical protein